MPPVKGTVVKSCGPSVARLRSAARAGPGVRRGCEAEGEPTSRTLSMPYGHRRGEDPRRYPVHAAVYDGELKKLATTLLAKHATGGLADALAELDADGGGGGEGRQTPLQRAVRTMLHAPPAACAETYASLPAEQKLALLSSLVAAACSSRAACVAM